MITITKAIIITNIIAKDIITKNMITKDITTKDITTKDITTKDMIIIIKGMTMKSFTITIVLMNSLKGILHSNSTSR